jgi:hypothetical protein
MAFRRKKAIDLIVQKMNKKLVESELTDLDTVKSLAQDIELAVYRHTLALGRANSIILSWYDQRFVDLYVRTWRRIYLNLLIEQNNLREKIFIDKSIDVAKLPTMSNADLYDGLDTEYWAERKQAEALRQSQFEGNLELKQDGLIQCFKCLRRFGREYSYNVEYTSVQTRSADEPMTNMCCCLRCGMRWRM